MTRPFDMDEWTEEQWAAFRAAHAADAPCPRCHRPTKAGCADPDCDDTRKPG